MSTGDARAAVLQAGPPVGIRMGPDAPPADAGLTSRGLVRDTAWAGAAEGLRLLAGLTMFLVVARELGPSGFGVFAGLQALAALLATLTGTAIVLLVLQLVVRDRDAVARVFPMALGLLAIAGVVVTAGAAVLGPLLLPVSWWIVTAFVAGEVLGVGAAVVSAGAVQAAEGFAPAARLRTTVVLARAGVVVALAATGHGTLTALALGLLAVGAASGVLAVRHAAARLGQPVRVAVPRPGDIRGGLSFAGAVAAFAVQEDADKALIVRLASPLDAGVYAAGYRAVQFALLPVRAVVSASHTRFLEHEDGVPRQHVRRSTRYTAVALLYAVLVALGLVAWAPALVGVLGDGFDDSALVIRWLALLLVLRAGSLFPFNGLMGVGETGVRTTIAIIAAAVNVAANVALIPLLGWRGAVLATVVTEVVFLAWTWRALIRLDGPEVANR